MRINDYNSMEHYRFMAVDCPDTQCVSVRKEWPKENKALVIHFRTDVFEHMTPEDINESFERWYENDPDYINPGPTNKELQNPAVRNAWNEWQFIYRLSVGKK